MKVRNELIGFLVCAMVMFLLFLFSLWGAIDAFRRAAPDGMVMVTRRGIQAAYPVHFFLACPTILLLITVGFVYKAWKVYIGEE